ncbi:response regulator transcription factor [Streptomyces sp. NPDC126499]|uniref:response regulator transcription factor n=1 Tax=Streptomyces sp. NPDC126499 TaxID=3155314 RepID=UPI00332CDACF
MAMLRVLVATDNPVVRAGLAVLLGAHRDIEVRATTRHLPPEAVRPAPDLIVLDGPPSAARTLETLAPVLLLTHTRARGTGCAQPAQLVHGEFDEEELIAAVRATAHAGGASTVSNILRFRNPSSRVQRFGLSAREVEVMNLIASGMTNQQIAATCSITEKTVKNHINRIFAKLHSTTRGEAIASWLGTRTAS